jgi:putative sigma-54 modulation protein
MRLALRGRNVELTPSIRQYAESKLAPLAGRLPAGVAVELELTEQTRARHIAEAIVFTKGPTIRASESGTSLRASIDRLATNLERQLTRYQEKRRDEPRRRAAHHGV